MEVTEVAAKGKASDLISERKSRGQELDLSKVPPAKSKHWGWWFAAGALMLVSAHCVAFQRLSHLQELVYSNDADLGILQVKHDLLEGADRSTGLSLGSEGYATIRCDIGTLIVKVVDVSKYANGTKLTLKFGNPLIVTIVGLRAKIEYCSYGTDVDLQARLKTAEQTMRTKNAAFSETLFPGAWTKVSVVLEGISPEHLDNVTLGDVSTRGIKLVGQ